MVSFFQHFLDGAGPMVFDPVFAEGEDEAGGPVFELEFAGHSGGAVGVAGVDDDGEGEAFWGEELGEFEAVAGVFGGWVSDYDYD